MTPQSSRHAQTERTISHLTTKTATLAVRVDAAAAVTTQRRRELEHYNAQRIARSGGRGKLSDQDKATMKSLLNAHQTAHKQETMLRNLHAQYDKQIFSLSEQLTAGVVADELSLLSSISRDASETFDPARFDRATRGLDMMDQSRDVADFQIDALSSAQMGQDDESFLLDIESALSGSVSAPPMMSMALRPAETFYTPSPMAYSVPVNHDAHELNMLLDAVGRNTDPPPSATTLTRYTNPDIV